MMELLRLALIIRAVAQCLPVLRRSHLEHPGRKCCEHPLLQPGALAKRLPDGGSLLGCDDLLFSQGLKIGARDLHDGVPLY